MLSLASLFSALLVFFSLITSDAHPSTPVRPNVPEDGEDSQTDFAEASADVAGNYAQTAEGTSSAIALPPKYSDDDNVLAAA
ncbi:unnamed protein product [Dibothriocephalus latus]|uniref:Secreted protein n=1 Tax=Dibothriocephalus latus TaxID=60516 RepID=A0A3P7NLI5_DIBLA|nr:unnamed protein product [Dibothriocephalus latus]